MLRTCVICVLSATPMNIIESVGELRMLSLPRIENDKKKKTGTIFGEIWEMPIAKIYK